MNTMQQMRDPSGGIPPQLLPHMHLISKHRYPNNNNPSLETIVGYLLEASKVLNESQPVQWQPLDCPTDGMILLTWQPPDLGTNFASDGYIWHEPETMYNTDVRGYNLQMYLHRAGFRPGPDVVASHSRRRYRLMPSQQNMGADPSIWLVHYSKGQPRDHIPIASVPISPQTHAQMQQRRMIFSQGALARKEFMLRDRANWPTIHAPGAFPRPGSANQAPGAPHRRGPSIGMPEPTVEEEEDVSRGDALDFMSPRDVSRMRYEQHHEWMEEILESPYRTLSIVPPELGLGRKGELESLTKGFFEAPVTVQENAGGQTSQVGRMDPGKAEEFTKLANQRLADMQAELDKMRQAHQKRMEKLRKSSALGAAEKRLRTLQLDSSRQKSDAGADDPSTYQDGLDEIAKEVEESVGRKIQTVRPINMVSKGGFQPDLTSQTTATSDSKDQNQVNGSSASASQQQATQSDAGNDEPTASTTVAPNTNQQPQYQSNVPSEDQTEPNSTSTADGNDVEMEDLDDRTPGAAPAGEVGDWVMVDDQDLNLNEADVGDDGIGDEFPDVTGQESGGTGLTPVAATSSSNSVSGSRQQQDEGALQQQHENQSSGQTPLDGIDFDLGNDFEDTAGDALADFGAAEDLGLDNMDDSAFGDAFPPNS